LIVSFANLLILVRAYHFLEQDAPIFCEFDLPTTVNTVRWNHALNILRQHHLRAYFSLVILLVIRFEFLTSSKYREGPGWRQAPFSNIRTYPLTIPEQFIPVASLHRPRCSLEELPRASVLLLTRLPCSMKRSPTLDSAFGLRSCAADMLESV